MTVNDVNDQTYRALIDRLVHSCLDGQGQVGRGRVLDGVWHRNVAELEYGAAPEQAAEMRRVNEVVAHFDQHAREVVARLMNEQYVAGVHDTLVALFEAESVPFDKGYEGDPHHDFMGRLDGWEWPLDYERE